MIGNNLKNTFENSRWYQVADISIILEDLSMLGTIAISYVPKKIPEKSGAQ